MNGLEVVSSFRKKVELFAKLFSSNSTLDDSGHMLPDFPPRTDTDLTHFNITNIIVADVIATLDHSKATGLDEIPVVLLQRCSQNSLQFSAGYLRSVSLNPVSFLLEVGICCPSLSLSWSVSAKHCFGLHESIPASSVFCLTY